MEFVKPARLAPGDTVAVLSPSWGGPSLYPHIFDNGLKVLKSWGLQVAEFPTARADPEFLRAHPQARADDVNLAFADPQVKAIIPSIGGDDSTRILPFLKKESIRQNPKIVMGYSDTTTLHVFCNLLGLVTFHGPSIMAGFAQMETLPPSFERHAQEMLFASRPSYDYAPYPHYSEGYPDWADTRRTGDVKPPKKNDGWKVLQGDSVAQGVLFGGCVEVLEAMKGTEFWPPPEFWEGKILLLETSEDKPLPQQVGEALRDYGRRGIWSRVRALLLGRPRDYTGAEKQQLESIAVNVIGKEFSQPGLPIIANVDFGHTDPQLVFPLGVRAEVDCPKRKLRLVEPWLR